MARAAAEGGLAVRERLYPSHVRPVLVHLRHSGLDSSHLTLRVLERELLRQQLTLGEDIT